MHEGIRITILSPRHDFAGAYLSSIVYSDRMFAPGV